LKLTQLNLRGITGFLLSATIIVALLIPAVPVSADSWSFNITNGSTTYVMTQAEFENMPQHTVTYTEADMMGGETANWTGVPLWRLVAKVDGSGGSFNDTFAATNYSVRATGNDSFHRAVGPSSDGTVIAHNDNLIVANLKNGQPVPSANAPLRLIAPNLNDGVTASHIVSLDVVYIITVLPSANGMIAPLNNPADTDSMVYVGVGGSQEMDVTPDYNFHATSFIVDNATVSPASSYTFSNVRTNHTFAVNFVANPAQPGWDLNGDHVCNISDVVKVGLKWGQTGAHSWTPEDLNGDGVINIGDVVVLGLHWGAAW